ncbi:hypothetical protein M9H77_08234 [Catharanthus roseus]|uniref:Uncharacterized protein n=1 Tax=Catharanthus roseus TaxID=4058 RepID=A0ACC0BX65_CATRO|nr:hypothetical protein M9H77_08234 [Catharanthus roseus]
MPSGAKKRKAAKKKKKSEESSLPSNSIQKSQVKTSIQEKKNSYEYEDIENVLCCLADIMKEEQLNVTTKIQIEDLMMQLRHESIHVKWRSSDPCYSTGIPDSVQTWLQDVQNRLIEPKRHENMAPDLLEKTLSSLLQDFTWRRHDIQKHGSNYLGGDFYVRDFACKDLQIDKLVMDWLDPLLSSLKYLVDNGRHPNFPLLPEKRGQELFQKLEFLKEFLEFPQLQVLLEKFLAEDLLIQLRFLIENAIYLSYRSSDQCGNNIDKLFLDLLVKMDHVEAAIRMLYFRFFKTSKAKIPSNLGIDLEAMVSVDSLLGNLDLLLKGQVNSSSIIPLDAHQFSSVLHQELSFLKIFLMDPNLKQYTESEPESFTSLLTQVEAIARKGASLTPPICDGEMKDDMAKEMNLVHTKLLEIVNLLNLKIRQIYLRVLKPPTSSNFPRNPNLGFIEFFIDNLDELLNDRADSIAYVKNEIETVKTDVTLLWSFLRDTAKNQELDNNIVRRVVDVAYEAERVVDLISASHFPRWYYILWLSDVIEKIKLLRKESTEQRSKMMSDVSVFKMEKDSIYTRREVYDQTHEEEVVGFIDEAEEIINQLTSGPEELDIISIVGMPGLGKTTLAKKVYEHSSIARYFHVRSWYCISQVYERRDLFLSILGDVTEVTNKIQKMNEEDMAEALYRNLKGKRYLIVIDDIWSVEPWVDIHKSFPDDLKGSRVLFTSRNKKVALQAKPSTRDPHYLRLFSEEESWELLKKKVFQERNCPQELYAIGKQIAKNSKGLPLSVIVIAGILSRVEKSEDCWRRVSESLGKQVGDSRQCRNVLELSYQHLPNHLKPCFLYLGVFPEDREILAWKLIRLWIAEGLVQKTESECLEEVAEGYLKDLIARSLVLVAEEKCNGGIKSCRLHDLLHEFSIEKAKDERVLMRSEQLVKTEEYRHCFYIDQDDLHRWMPYDPYVRSVLFFPTKRKNHDNISRKLFQGDISVLPYVLKLLRVLDLECLTLGLLIPSEIGLLVHLRYLAVRGPMDHVPSSIGNLCRLETLNVIGTKGEVRLPEALFKMPHLKHVTVNKRAAFVLSSTSHPMKSLRYSSIQQLSSPAFCHGDGTTEKVITSLKNLQKLKCLFLESWDNYKGCNKLPVLDSVSELESLNVTYHGIVKHPYKFSLPSKLKELTLSKFRFPWNEISKIGRLVPQLEVLKLLFKASEGPRWNVSYDEFPNLKFLKLESLDIVEWDVSCDAFPCLEQLVLERCKKLKEICSNFGELATLRRIEVQWCSYSATKAIWEIQEQQQELGGYGLKVLILPSNWDSAPAS